MDTINVLTTYELFGAVDYSSGDYQYDELRVITRDGELFYAEDAGCSCPIPFDGFTVDGGTDPEKGYVLGTKHLIAERIQARLAECEGGYEHTRTSAMDLIERLMR